MYALIHQNHSSSCEVEAISQHLVFVSFIHKTHASQTPFKSRFFALSGKSIPFKPNSLRMYMCILLTNGRCMRLRQISPKNAPSLCVDNSCNPMLFSLLSDHVLKADQKAVLIFLSIQRAPRLSNQPPAPPAQSLTHSTSPPITPYSDHSPPCQPCTRTHPPPPPLPLPLNQPPLICAKACPTNPSSNALAFNPTGGSNLRINSLSSSRSFGFANRSYSAMAASSVQPVTFRKHAARHPVRCFPLLQCRRMGWLRLSRRRVSTSKIVDVGV